MKTKLPFTKKTSNTFYSLLAFCLCINYGSSQQVLGQFPEMDGGLESQTATTTMSSAGSSQSGTPQTAWTVSSTSNSGTRTISDVPADARSGNFSAAFSVLAGASNNRLQTPSPTNPTIQISTEYTVQFFYKAGVDPGTDLDPGIYLNNTTSGVAGDKTDVTPFAVNTWTKTYRTITTGAAFNASNWAVARISTATSGGYNSVVSVDDFVVYPGVYDDVAPNAPTGGAYSANGSITTLSWTPPAGGVDGGGYVVVKYTTMPADNNDLNQNGIYKVGNTTTNGTGGLTGTVVYIGTAPTFDDTYNGIEYYKIYAVDKAFNYSEELLLRYPPLSVSKNELSANLKIYPNPAKDYITIESNNIKISSVELYNVLGKEVLSVKSLSNNQLNVSNISKGIYFLKVNAEGANATRKIVIE